MTVFLLPFRQIWAISGADFSVAAHLTMSVKSGLMASELSCFPVENMAFLYGLCRPNRDQYERHMLTVPKRNADIQGIDCKTYFF